MNEGLELRALSVDEDIGIPDDVSLRVLKEQFERGYRKFTRTRPEMQNITMQDRIRTSVAEAAWNKRQTGI